MRRLLLFTAWLLLASLSPVRADDLSVYGGMGVDLQPNIMIILDNSGSMDTADIPGEIFDKTKTYTGSRTAGKVYSCTSKSCTEFAASVSAIGCTTMKNDLNNKGYASGNINGSAPYSCSNKKKDNRTLRTGNFLNYSEQGLGAMRKRIDVAKEVVTDLINKTVDVRFGLFKFNNSQGGTLVAPCGTAKTTLLNAVNNYKAETWTPLAETLAETGLYFAGKKSWFNSGVTYTTPMQYSCQKNYIVLVTDGEPTEDKDTLLSTGSYINGDKIGDHDGDGKDPGSYASNGSDYLDDVAHYLFNKDCNPNLGSPGEVYEKQTITTYTIGFKTNQELLQETAENGGGEYFTAENYSTLNEAFDHIISSIQERNAVFVAPVVPVNQVNRSYAGNRVYLGYFRPEITGRWSGNLKSYALTAAGDLKDVNNQPVLDGDGLLLPGSQSRWSPEVDGPNVKKGGAGELLIGSAATRKIYTYLGVSAQLNTAGNAVVATNTALTNTHLGVATAADRTNVINAVRGEGIDWPLGDIVHSEPVVVHYGSGASLKAYIFVGANDGMLHAFDDATGQEVWGFVPPGQLSQLQNLSGPNHNYYVDGSPTYYDLGSKKVLMFGERRGGDRYYALDITDPLDPRWLYEINAQKLSASGIKALLGKSWGRPKALVQKSGGTKRTVFLLPGGYDLRQDAAVSGDDSVGRAIYAVDALTGALTSINFNGGNWSEMKNSILDVVGYDTNEDDAIDRIYAGDLGGRIFALRDENASGTWQQRVLFQVPSTLNGKNMGKKFMFAPSVTKESSGEYVFIGTGDRENPTDKSLTDAFYAIKSNWTPGTGGTLNTLTPADLVNVATNAVQGSDATARKAVEAALKEAKGWYFPLPHTGERVVSSPVVFDGVVFFTTYTPPTGVVNASDNPCVVNTSLGTARLYAVDYKTGGAAYKFTTDAKRIRRNAVPPNNGQPDGTEPVATPEDRSEVIGNDPTPTPTVVILEDGAEVWVPKGSGGGENGGIVGKDVDEKSLFNSYFWQQLQ